MTPRTAALAALLALSSCTPRPRPQDLLRAPEALVEAAVAGNEVTWVRGQMARPQRINDVVRKTLPAAPPSRLGFRLDVPRRARLELACGIPPEHHDKPGVEFVVKVERDGREDTVWTMLLDPLNRPEHKKWVEASVDLSGHAGRGVLLTLETRGFDAGGARRTAFWGAPVLATEATDAPLVVVYLVDTLRADHTTPYGYARDTTPELQRFAGDAVVFAQAISHSSWTKPAVASVLTSLLPGRHRTVQLRDRLDAGHVTLAEMMAAKGYATLAVIANSVIYGQGTNFEQGFDVYAGLHGEGDRPSKLVEAAGVVDAALRLLDARRGFPTFLYVHTMDPHVPYAPPPPFDRMFEPHPTPEHPAVDPRHDYKEPKDRERMIAQYDGDIAYGDQEFGRFVRELRARGLYDQALIVFTADHGEEFLDHGQWTHGKSVFDELIHVPLIVKFPGQVDAGARVRQQVQLVDIVPTVLQSQGLPVPEPPHIAGRPLQATLRAGAPEPPAVSEISHRGFVAHGMRTSRDKYVRRFSPDDDELYFDLVRDPGEKVNRVAEADRRVRLLKAGVEAAMVPNPYRHHLRAVGGGHYALRLRTGGWFEGVEPVGFSERDRYAVEGNGRKLSLRLRPGPGQPREVAFSIRPQGAPVWLEGTRDGRALRPGDVLIAREGVPAREMPLPLPEIETEKERTEDIFAPPPSDRQGLHVWLTLTPGRQIMEAFDKASRERLCALGYIECR
ncbi:MAG TPA: sulfatase [Vicinamibacteria bacterium]|nr:sulfatase [Vicinamibacteria bacterium]